MYRCIKKVICLMLCMAVSLGTTAYVFAADINATVDTDCGRVNFEENNELNLDTVKSQKYIEFEIKEFMILIQSC